MSHFVFQYVYLKHSYLLEKMAPQLLADEELAVSRITLIGKPTKGNFDAVDQVAAANQSS
jgi:hypothetical protein